MFLLLNVVVCVLLSFLLKCTFYRFSNVVCIVLFVFYYIVDLRCVVNLVAVTCGRSTGIIVEVDF